MLPLYVIKIRFHTKRTKTVHQFCAQYITIEKRAAKSIENALVTTYQDSKTSVTHDWQSHREKQSHLSKLGSRSLLLGQWSTSILKPESNNTPELKPEVKLVLLCCYFTIFADVSLL